MKNLQKSNSPRQRRKNFSFEELGIFPGDILIHKWDNKYRVVVCENNKVSFRNHDRLMSLSEAHNLLAWGRGKAPATATLFWKFKDEILNDRRTRLEFEKERKNSKYS